jgi:N-methylhydantoinase B
VTDAVLGAVAAADADRVVAGCQGTMNNVTFGGRDPRTGGQYTFYETQAGGFGGRRGADGMDAVHVHMSNTLNTPAEVLETAYPLRVLEYALRPDSGGAGRWRGGLGLRRTIQVRDHTATVSLLADRQRHAPYGLRGGADGSRGETRLLIDAAPDQSETERTTERLPAKTTRSLAAGDAVSLLTPGAGGYGDPAERDPTAVARDLRHGLVSPETVRAAYGLDPDALSDETDTG